MSKPASAVQCLIFVVSLMVGSVHTSFAQVLAKQGDHFTVDGQPKYLIFVSYFDAMRRANSGGANTGDLDADFGYLKSKGIDGIRIFPNWWVYSCPRTQDSQTLFTSAGAINGIGNPGQETMWLVFKRILDRAAMHGLIVDVTFTRETFQNAQGEDISIPVTAYQNAIVTVAQRLRDAGGYRHVLFDIQNEYANGNRLTQSQAQTIVSAVHQTDPSRIATTSEGDGAFERDFGMDVVTYHRIAFFNDPNWYTASTVLSAIDSRRSAMAPTVKPIYAQEPTPFRPLCNSAQEHDADGEHHQLSAKNAKTSGAAAWTFHTRQSFLMASSRLIDALNADAAQKAALEAIRGSVNSVGWGLCAWELSTGQMTVTSGAASYPIDIMKRGAIDDTNCTWSVQTPSWITVSPSTGSGNSATLSVSMAAGGPRCGTVTFVHPANQTTKAKLTVAQSLNGTDILWQRDASGATDVWHLEGSTLSCEGPLSWPTDPKWQVTGTGRFNGDAVPDILWKHKDTGQVVVWLMNGVMIGSAQLSAGSGDPSWQLIGADNFSGTPGGAQDDLLWQHPTSGQILVWHMTGTTYNTRTVVDTISDLNWVIKGIGDFSSDGHVDILLQHKTTGQLVLWFMTGTTKTGAHTFAAPSDPNWKAVGAVDLNADSKADILRWHSVTGQVIAWLMDGTAIIGGPNIGVRGPASGLLVGAPR